MEITEFAEILRRRLLRRLKGMVSEIRLQRVLKNNSLTFIGLVILEDDCNVSPTIYLERFFNKYQSGRSMEDIEEDIVAFYHKAHMIRHVDVSFMYDWGKVKSMVAYKLINTARNQELLKSVPHKEMMDLSMVCYISLNQNSGTILIHNCHCDMWGIDGEELFRVAKENTPRICPASLTSMRELIEELLMKTLEEEEGESPEMYILSNESKTWGAAAILYPQQMERIAEKLLANLYILPSSVHETLIVPARENTEPNELVTMVREVNMNVVRVDEILSDNAYFYDRELKEIKIVA